MLLHDLDTFLDLFMIISFTWFIYDNLLDKQNKDCHGVINHLIEVPSPNKQKISYRVFLKIYK